MVVRIVCDATTPEAGAGVTRDEERKTPPPRPPCPLCGSSHTQPFPHAGPAARVNMQCTDCGHLFHAKIVRS